MGVLFDYFRAPNATDARRVMDLPGGAVGAAAAGEPALDVVDAKGVDPAIIFGQLIALIRSVPWTPDVISTTMVWPPPDTAPSSAEEAAALSADSPWATGPWLEEIDIETRDTLAALDDDRLQEIATEWAQIEEFAYYSNPGDGLRELISELTGLARRARDAGDRLYCWTCL